MAVKSTLFIFISYLLMFCSSYSTTFIDIDPYIKNISRGSKFYSLRNPNEMEDQCPTNPWHQIVEYKPLESFDIEDWVKHEADIPYLPPLYGHKINLNEETVSLLGKHKLEQDLLQNLAEIIEEQSPSVLANREEIQKLGNIFCGFSPDHMSNMNIEVLRSLWNDNFFQSMSGCREEKMRILLEKLKSTGVLGSSKTWKAETVERLGRIVSALPPEDFKQIRPRSLSSISPEVIRSTHPETLKGLNTQQLRNLPRKALLEWRRATKDSRPLYAKSTKNYFNATLVIFSTFILNMLN